MKTFLVILGLAVVLALTIGFIPLWAWVAAMIVALVAGAFYGAYKENLGEP